MTEATIVEQARPTFRDWAQLGKPRLSSLVLFTAAIGVLVADSSLLNPWMALFLVATGFLVMASNVLNCVIERDTDSLMERTRKRPVVTGLIAPVPARIVGVATAVISLALIGISTNGLTMALGAIAFVTYVGFYTPLKRFSSLSLYVGAIPGAIPPLMGWTAVTGTVDAPGIFLFALLFVWQLPHFLAIALFRKNDYSDGGLQVASVSHGDTSTRWQLLFSAVLLAATSWIAIPLEIAGLLYGAVALLLGAAFIYLACVALVKRDTHDAAKRAFFFSLIYLPLLSIALLIGL